MKNAFISFIALLSLSISLHAQFPLFQTEDLITMRDCIKNRRMHLIVGDDLLLQDSKTLVMKSKLNVSPKYPDKVEIDLKNYDSVYTITLMPYDFFKEWEGKSKHENSLRSIFFPDDKDVKNIMHDSIFILYNDFDIMYYRLEKIPYDDYHDHTLFVSFSENTPHIKSLLHQLKYDEKFKTNFKQDADRFGLYYVTELSKINTIYDRLRIQDFEYLKSRIIYEKRDDNNNIIEEKYYGALSNNLDKENFLTRNKDLYTYSSVLGPYKIDSIQLIFEEMAALIWKGFDFDTKLTYKNPKGNNKLIDKKNEYTGMGLKMWILPDTNNTGYSYIQVDILKDASKR